MSRRLRVGIIGIGAIGRLHFTCWRQSPSAEIGAIASRDPRKRSGDWAGGGFNLGDLPSEQVDLHGVAAYESAADLIADPAIDIVDICGPTPQHAPLAIAALRAGKHVVCEKPMALSLGECDAMAQAAEVSGRQLMIAHCLRFWPQYLKAREILEGGEFGRPLYASFERSSAAPSWSAGGWLMRPAESGGVLDMHIHDIDAALWWFGRPAEVQAAGFVSAEGVPMIMDALWTYPGGLAARLHGAWDLNGGAFRHAFHLVLERATITYDLALAPHELVVLSEGQTTKIIMEETSVHQAELDEFSACIAAGRPFTRFTPAESRASVELGLEELSLLGGRHRRSQPSG